MIEYFLKFGSPELVSSIRKYQSEIRILLNCNLMDNGVDRGSQIRDTAAFVINLLTNFKELEDARNQGQRLREKYIGISSNYNDKPSNYNNYSSNYKGSSDSYSVSSISPYNYNPPQSGSNFIRETDNRYAVNNPPSEKNKKIAESLFSGFKNEEYKSPNCFSSEYSENISSNEYKTYEKSNAPDIFAKNYSNPTNPPSKESYNPSNALSSNKPPDIFSSFIRKESYENTKEKSAENLFQGPSKEFLTENKANAEYSNNIYQGNVLQQEKKKPSENSYSDIFYKETYDDKTNTYYDIFSEPVKNYPKFNQNKIIDDHPIDIFSAPHESNRRTTQDSEIINNSKPHEINPSSNHIFSNLETKQNSDIFHGMSQKRKVSGEENAVILSNILEIPENSEKKNELNQKWNLESLNLNIPSEINTISPENISITKVNQIGYNKNIPKVKNNLREIEPSPQVVVAQPKKNKLTPEELEKKLLTLDF